ncbi:hypothetical protein P9112_014152 [Eukaryota sp. TZLM1-RC]
MTTLSLNPLFDGPNKSSSTPTPSSQTTINEPYKPKSKVRLIITLLIVLALMVLALVFFYIYRVQNPLFDCDILIINGLVYDGSLSPGSHWDICINGDIIDSVVHPSERSSLSSKTVIDAQTRIVTPGFIDGHAHFFGNPDNQEDLDQYHPLAEGVTTRIYGQNGYSPDEDSTISDSLDLDRFLDGIERDSKLGTNIGMFVGHSSLRIALAEEPKEPWDGLSEEEQSKIKSSLQDLMSDERILGLSFNLEDGPGDVTDSYEMNELLPLVASAGKIASFHVQNENSGPVMDAARSIADHAGRNGVSYYHAHIKVKNPQHGPSEADDLLSIHEQSLRNHPGLERSFAMVYPWIKSAFSVGYFFNQFTDRAPDYIESLPYNQERYDRAYLDIKSLIYDPEKVVFMFDYPPVPEGNPDSIKTIKGLNLLEASALFYEESLWPELWDTKNESSFDHIDLLIVLYLEEFQRAPYYVSVTEMTDDVLDVFIQSPRVGFSTDGGLTFPHPRYAGSYARIFEHYVFKRQLLSVESAIHKMTGFVATNYKLANRGFIKAGFKADLAIFRPEDMRQIASFNHVLEPSLGMWKVLVNGKVAFEDGEVNERAGQVVKSLR